MLVEICDLTGRVLGLAFAVDHAGTLLTAYEVVDGQEEFLLRPQSREPADAVRVGSDRVTGLPEEGLALVRGELLVPPLPLLVVGAQPGPLRLLDLPGFVAGTVSARYAGDERFHSLTSVWQLTVDQVPYGLPLGVAGAPVLDAASGAVVAVATVALRCRRRGAVLAVPLRESAGLADVLARSAASVPAYGPALNLAGVLQLTSRRLPLAAVAERVPREDVDWGGLDHPLTVLVGPGGSGRTTELAALAVGRAQAVWREPTLWLRGSDLSPRDATVLDAAERLLPDVRAAARVAAQARRPLLLALDAPEEMPPALAARAGAWLADSAAQLRESGIRWALGCGPEFWEQAGSGLDARVVPLGPLPPATAAALGQRWAVPARTDPLTTRLLGELRAAQPALRLRELTGREILSGWFDLLCLRTAEALGGGRRILASTAGRAHEAARRMLGPEGALAPADFAFLFPGRWGAAALAAGLLVPSGTGYRFPHTPLADWLQAQHLHLPAALALLLDPPAGPPPVRGRGAHRRGGPRVHRLPPPRPAPDGPRPTVPRWRIGPVVQALLGVGEEEPAVLDDWLDWIARQDGSGWWTERLLTGVLRQVPDLRAHRALLLRLAARDQLPRPLWDLDPELEFELLGEVLAAGRAEAATVAADRLRARPAPGYAALCRWLPDERLSGHAAELLLATRQVDVDALAEALVAAAHPHADGVLRLLARLEPAACCRAVDRWAHDPRRERHVAAAVLAPQIRPETPPDRALLRFAAAALLARPDEETLHGAALAVLVRDPETRPRALRDALGRYLAGDPLLPAAALAPALDSDPAAVLAVFARRLGRPGEEAAILRVLGETPAPRARRAAGLLVAAHLTARPESAPLVAGWAAARLRHGPGEREQLLGLVRDVAAGGSEAVRQSFLAVLRACPGPLCDELLAVLAPVGADPMQDEPRVHGKV
ncbi:serine protease [Streptacidiphilus monticola]|uniref:Serine protease n=1 Tax=Streptacidiphilus monticola TaxID=2161674 RepID=A0ABW1FY35_9ACTN